MYVNQELPDVQAELRKGRGAKDQIANICWSQKRQGKSRKTSPSVSLMTLKPLTAWITRNWKILKEMEILDHLGKYLPLDKSVCRLGSNSSNWAWSNRLVPNRKRSTPRLYIVTLLI